MAAAGALYQERDQESRKLIDHVYHRLQTKESFYEDFSRTSLTIAQKNYEQALEETKELQAKIAGLSHYNTLKVINLLRMASIYEILDQTQEKEAVIQSFSEADKDIASKLVLGNHSFLDHLSKSES